MRESFLFQKLPTNSKRIQDFLRSTSNPAKVGILTDFDGTLAEMVLDPLDARPLEGAVEVLHRLSLDFGVVAVISGRPASFLVNKLGIGKVSSKLQVFGLYGMESANLDGTITSLPSAEKYRSQVIEMTKLAHEQAPNGVIVEPKGLSLALHWRTSPQQQPWVEAFVSEMASKYSFRPYPGRMSKELKPPLETDKGSTAKQVLQGLDSACFIGDDLGDVPAFEALKSIYEDKSLCSYLNVGVRNSEIPSSMLDICDFILEGPQEVVSFLDSFLD